MKSFKILRWLTLCLVICQTVSQKSSASATNKSKLKRPHHLAYFYDPKTNRTIKPPTVSFGADGQLKQTAPTGPNFGRRCDCKQTGISNVCSCCAGIKLPRIRFQREMCTKFQYNLSQRNQMLMDVTMNGNTVASQMFNFRAPDMQPLCVPLPVPLVPLRFDACIKIFDVNFMGQNAHFCMDWSARVEMAPLILLHFDCAQFGSQGISLLKPGQQPQTGGAFPSVLQPGVGGGGGGGGSVGGGGLPVKPIPGETGGSYPGGDNTLPVKPFPETLTQAPPSSSVGGSSPGGDNTLPVKPFPETLTQAPPSSSVGGSSPGGDNTLPVKPFPETLTQAPPVSPVGAGPDENGNLPQIAAGTDDLDPVEDLKNKNTNTTRCSRIRVPVYTTIQRLPTVPSC